MLFIVGLGTILRLAFINKPDGLWNDEYVSWFIASIPLGKRFINEVFAQCHMPFYYLYLKFFIHFWGNSDLMLRLTSIPPGILSIIAMYFVGKEFKDERLGILSASVTALSSFLIYFSQEVRFYGLLFLFASLSLLFTIKLCKKQNLSNIIFYIISNFLIIITHTIGFVFVLFNLLFVSLYIIKLNKGLKKPIITIWGSLFFLTLIFSPLIFSILTTRSHVQWWGHFTVSKLGFLITDYFSPVLTNIVSSPDNFFYNFNFSFLIFAMIPAIIALTGIINALITKNENQDFSQNTSYSLFKINHSIFFISLAYVIILILAAIFGKLQFTSKYAIEIYPTLILLMCSGLLQLKKGWRYFLIFLFCFLNLFYLYSSPISAPKLRRNEGNKIVADLLRNAKLNKGDFILINYYPQTRFEKYFNFTPYNIISVNKVNFSEYLGINTKEEFKQIENNYFDRKLKNELITKLKPNQKLVIIVLNSVAMYSPTQIDVLKQTDKYYKQTPFLFLVFSQIKNQELEQCMKTLQIQRLEQKGSWSVITFVKNKK